MYDHVAVTKSGVYQVTVDELDEKKGEGRTPTMHWMPPTHKLQCIFVLLLS